MNARVILALIAAVLLQACRPDPYEQYARNIEQDADSVLIAYDVLPAEVFDTVSRNNLDDFGAQTPPEGLQALHMEMLVALQMGRNTGRVPTMGFDGDWDRHYLEIRHRIGRLLEKKGAKLDALVARKESTQSHRAVAAPPPIAQPVLVSKAPTAFPRTARPVLIPQTRTAPPSTKSPSAVSDGTSETGMRSPNSLLSPSSAAASVPTDPNETFFEFQVEKPVVQVPGTASPKFPEVLRSSGVEGEVQAQFVVREDGRADISTLKILKSSNDLFSSAIRDALPNLRFYAAEHGGKKVKQLVQQTFQFRLDR